MAASTPASASAAVSTASDATGQLGWPSGWAGGVVGCTRRCQGSPTWPSVGGRRASPAIADWLVVGGRWCQDSPTWVWVGGRRAACLPVGASVAWAWATAVRPARLVAASRAPSTRADASLDLDMGASDRWARWGGWLAGPRGPAGEQLPPAAR